MRRNHNSKVLVALAALLAASSAACTCKTTHTNGSSTTSCQPDLTITATCVLNGNNVKGHIVFGNGVAIVPGADVIIQWSTDSFATVVNSGAVINNAQGFVAIPFNFCGPVNQTFQLRAFQSVDHTTIYQQGQPEGRHDGTDNGNGTFLNLVNTQANKSDWNITEGVELVLDGNGPQ